MKKSLNALTVIIAATILIALSACSKEVETSGDNTAINSNAKLAVVTESAGPITVSGGGTMEEFGKKSTISFNAVRQANGTTEGHIILKFRAADGSLWVDVDCIRVFGNKATLSGVISKLRIGPKADPIGFPAPPFVYIGGRVSFTVEDNGEGSATPYDFVSDVGVVDMNTIATCADEMLTYLPLKGNVQIRK